MISDTPPSTCRFWSVSSMRRRNTPSFSRATRQFSSAVYSPPMCMKPVGLGAKRVVHAAARGGYFVSNSAGVFVMWGKSASAMILLM